MCLGEREAMSGWMWFLRGSRTASKMRGETPQTSRSRKM